MKIVFMGTPDFSVGALEALIQAGHTITAVVTQPDKPKGRGKEMQFPPVKECAVKHNIPVFQPIKIKSEEEIAILRQYEADVFVVAAFGQILSKEILTMPKYGCINIHASLLPEYRGAAPINRVILDGKEKTGVTIMQMDEGIDTGDMLLMREVSIEPKETADSLFEKLSALGAELIVEALDKLERGEIKAQKQDESKASYARMMRKEIGLIDFSLPAEEIERKIRGLNSWPSAYTYYNGKMLKIWDADILQEKCDEGTGVVVRVSKDTIYVNTGEGILALNEIQLEGKKRMQVKDFLLGYQIKPGEILGLRK
ncbi:MAG: methionyl-tRNA formyltransferase [Lachnospiraceae bacterium]|nr:methionyl-tRNA formyltransferase [Lachnospiraceae bacterium]